MALPPSVAPQYCLASLAAGISSTGISHDLLPPIPSIHLSEVNSSPCPGISPQCLDSSSQLLHRPGALYPCPEYVWLQQGLLILIPFGWPQVSCFTFSLKRVSSDSDSCPSVGIGPLPQLPHPPRAGPVLLTLLFLPPIPSSYLVLPGTVNSFLVRSSCPLSACPPRTSESEGVFLTYPWREVCSLSSSSRHLVPLSVICSLLLWLPLKDN